MADTRRSEEGDDPGAPARLVPVRFDVDGAHLNGLVYVPAGTGPHPAVVVLHGLPGYERNLDLAHT